ncbi:hypothetical protein CIC12_19035 [Burkholderia sp. SG-MS1]|uniref:tyrosine-type recombinase/integrase n=1 Tax=Paraburkholderia sp. SG-MS1 TaxID=2023741 RepID=UPI001447D6E7|nr:site-specific integrase [Paraburkholderia sp. SG-MS1]NKJ48796.1 hypothetical protein [Paraburkholderia sp. SG-MS1]
MNPTYITRELRASSGERFAILLYADGGHPLYWPNLFALTQLRACSLATNTICRALQNIGFLHQWAAAREIDIDHRLVHGDFLTLDEVESLANELRYSRRYLVRKGKAGGHPKRHSLEAVRRKLRTHTARTVGTYEASIRIADIALYLEWHATRRTTKLVDAAAGSHLRALTQSVINHLRSLKPKSKSSDSDVGRTGLLPTQRSVLLGAIRPDSEANPFRGEFQRLRNYLYISLAYQVGYRRGESLQLKVEDIDVHLRLLRIHRSADDKSDLRSVQPRTKTLARTVPLSAELAEELYDYIDRVWSKIPVSQRRHGFVWTTVNGHPLALSTVNDMFRRLRKAVPDLPPDLTPHTLRHDWNERFSEAIDALPPERKPGDDKESRTRCHMMGWTAGSSMAGNYTRRYVREKAAEIAEEMTRRLTDQPD